MLGFLNDYPKASFGFIGSNTIDDNFIEPIEETQRFGIYSNLMSIFFSDSSFKHLDFKEKSAYILFNRLNEEVVLAKF